MGTNYYATMERNKCDCCGRSDKQIVHIGKNSYGWAFNFQGYRKNDCSPEWFGEQVTENLTSWKEYKEWLKTQTIVDEYGEYVPYGEFVEMVETWGSPHYVNPQNKHKNLDHIDYVKHADRYVPQSYFDTQMHWHDELGYSFGVTNFS